MNKILLFPVLLASTLFLSLPAHAENPFLRFGTQTSLISADTIARKSPKTTKKKKVKTAQPAKSATKTKAATTKDSTSSKTPATPKQVYSSKGSMFQITKEKENWFFEIPDSLLGRLILAVTRYTATPAGFSEYGGEELADQAVYFELSPDKTKMFLKSNILYAQSDTLDKINKAVTASTADPIIAAFKVEKNTGKAYKVNIGTFFLQENCFGIPASDKTSLHLTSPLPDATYIESIHSYPINTEIRTIRTYRTTGTGNNLASQIANTVSIGLNTSFVVLPKEPMRPRLFDPRVGFFTDSYYTFGDDQQRVSLSRFVARWRLEPKDSTDMEKMKRGELVNPKKQIVYYIDPATPPKWRPYLIQGVKDWNKAFEQAGFKDAITAKEWPEKDSTMSLEDARFSVIRYLASTIPNAYGPQVHDPRSGEIIESHVGWYHNVMSLVHDWYMLQTANCDPRARKAKFDDDLMGKLIRFVSSHEIGHTLGLRHNFGSSSTVPVDSLRSKQWVKEHGHTPSIMDYARFNYVAQPEDGMEEEELFPRINDYDKWAIEWGYKPVFNATDTESDRYEMDKITTPRLAANPRLWWGDGEKRSSFDPRCQTEDLGNDAPKASAYGIKNLQRMIEKLPDWTYWGNDTNSQNLAEMYQNLLMQYMRYCNHVKNNISGFYWNQKTVNEPGAIFTPTPRQKEKTVLPFLNKYVYSEPTWLTQVSYFNRLNYSPENIYKTLASRYVSSLISESSLSRMNSNYPTAEFLPELQDLLFKELKSNQPLSPYRRILQHSFVDELASLFNDNKQKAGGDVTASVLYALKDLQKKTLQASRTATNAVTRAHYAQLADQIRRALAVQ